MSELRYYLSIFLRRLPIFLPLVTVLSAIGVIVAMTLPPAYVSTMRLVVESPRIPRDLAPSTVQLPPLEQMEIVRQRLLTRVNLLRIAREQNVFADIEDMSADEIVDAMRARTTITMSSSRDAANLMTISFEARGARIAASVLGDYLTLIEREDARVRQSRAGETLEFFEQQVAALGQEIEAQSARILAFKNANSDALPETLQYRVGQQRNLQEQLAQIALEVSGLTEQRDRMQELFETTGRVAEMPGRPTTPAEQELAQLQRELRTAQAVFSEESSRVQILKNRVANLERELASTPIVTDEGAAGPSALDIQLAEIDSRLRTLERRRQAAEAALGAVTETIERTPEVSIGLDELERHYANIQGQFQLAQSRLATARTGELIETRSRGQEISVIEPPAVPTEPTKPNRLLIAGGGVFAGLAAGAGLILLLELLNNAPRRAEDIVKRFGIAPIATIPVVRTRQDVMLQRGAKLLLLLLILVGVPAAVYWVHNNYLPLDLVAEKVMNRLGVRL